MPPTSQQQSRLLCLPAELRNNIYRFTLCVSYKEVPLSHNDETDKDRPQSVLALLQTCRQVFKETEAIFYQANNLRLYSRDEFTEFINHVSPERTRHITALTIQISTGDSGDLDDQIGWVLLRFLPRLTTLVLKINLFAIERIYDMRRGCQHSGKDLPMLKTFSQVRGLTRFDVITALDEDEKYNADEELARTVKSVQETEVRAWRESVTRPKVISASTA